MVQAQSCSAHCVGSHDDQIILEDKIKLPSHSDATRLTWDIPSTTSKQARTELMHSSPSWLRIDTTLAQKKQSLCSKWEQQCQLAQPSGPYWAVIDVCWAAHVSPEACICTS